MTLEKIFEKENPGLKAQGIRTDGVHVVGIEVWSDEFVAWLKKKVITKDKDDVVVFIKVNGTKVHVHHELGVIETMGVLDAATLLLRNKLIDVWNVPKEDNKEQVK